MCCSECLRVYSTGYLIRRSKVYIFYRKRRRRRKQSVMWWRSTSEDKWPGKICRASTIEISRKKVITWSCGLVTVSNSRHIKNKTSYNYTFKWVSVEMNKKKKKITRPFIWNVTDIQMDNEFHEILVNTWHLASHSPEKENVICSSFICLHPFIMTSSYLIIWCPFTSYISYGKPLVNTSKQQCIQFMWLWDSATTTISMNVILGSWPKTKTNALFRS